MPTLRRYVARQFVANLAIVMLAFVGLLQLFELLAQSDDIIKLHGARVAAFAWHALLNLPEIVTVVAPICVLMAALLTLARLALQNEVLALKSAGLSYYRLLLAFVPVALAVGLLNLLVADQLMPRTSRALVQWNAESPKAKTDISIKDGFWVRDGNLRVRVGRVSPRGEKLAQVTLFELDRRLQVVLRVIAETAEFKDGGWLLHNANRLALGEGEPGKFSFAETMPWKTRLTPRQFSDFASPSSTLAFADLARFITHAGIGSHPVSYYLTLFHKRLALPLTALMMVLLAAPVAQSMQRQGGLARGMAVGVVLGFLYFVANGFVLTLGEAGALPPAVAAWSPSLLFATIGAAALVRMERT
ncbi:MAG: LPS export ABC transporter permease LptG [Dongiaceae bacterium]